MRDQSLGITVKLIVPPGEVWIGTDTSLCLAGAARAQRTANAMSRRCIVTPQTIHRTGLAGLLLLTLLLLAISGCGGGESSIVPDTGGSTGTDTPTDWGSGSGSRILPLGSALPSVPDELSSDSSARTSSELVDYSGTGFVEAAGATIDGDNVVLQSTADAPAWAL
jgi:hypothetical protein